jgi:hypothetical protein
MCVRVSASISHRRHMEVNIAPPRAGREQGLMRRFFLILPPLLLHTPCCAAQLSLPLSLLFSFSFSPFLPPSRHPAQTRVQRVTFVRMWGRHVCTWVHVCMCRPRVCACMHLRMRREASCKRASMHDHEARR